MIITKSNLSDWLSKSAEDSMLLSMVEIVEELVVLQPDGL
jgi:hypothetical protein